MAFERDLDERGLPDGYALQDGLEMSPADAAQGMAYGAGFILIDVREAEELVQASLDGAVHIPLGDLKARVNEIDADEETPIGVLCHHGQRSLYAAVYLHQEGLTGARSIAGGIDLWSRAVDTSVPRY